MYQPKQNSSIQEKLNRLDEVIWALALPVALFTRKDIGYRMLHRMYISGVAAVMYIMAVFISPADGQHSLAMYSLIVFLSGVTTFFARRRDFNKFKKQHSCYIGTSRIETGKSPAFVIKNRRLERIVEPLICFMVGATILQVSLGVGFWIMLASAALVLVEAKLYFKTREMQMDMVDGLVFSEYQGNIVEKFEQPPADQNPKHSAISTGLGDDIFKKVQKRKGNN